MLSPDIGRTKTNIVDAFNEVLRIDGYAYGCRNTRIGELADDPDWLPAVRHRVSMLSDVAKTWEQDKPDIWSSVLTQFISYASSFKAVAEMKKNGSLKTREDWISVLKSVLTDPLKAAVSATDKADGQLKSQYTAFKDIQPLLEDSIAAGWKELASEEAKMAKIAAAIATLQERVNALEENITSDVISSGKSYISSSVTIVYKLVSATGESVPFLSAAAAVFTVGKMFYDIIENTKEIGEDLDEIAKLQLEATHQAQAAAGTKAVLQLLYELEKAFLLIQDAVPAIRTMWQTELHKVEAAINALENGVDPDSYLEIATFSVANANWQAIAGFVQDIVDMPRDYGRPVILTPGEKPYAGEEPAKAP